MTAAMAGAARSARSRWTTSSRESLKKFANEEKNKATIGGAGNDWQIAVVRSVSRESVRLGLDGGETGTLHADDVKWAAHFKREGGGTGLKAGDVIFVAGSPTPDITVQLITDYGVPKTARRECAVAPAPGAGGAGRAGRDGPAHGPRARDVRRLFVRVEQVQPRHPGQAPAGLVVQAVRLRGGDGDA